MIKSLTYDKVLRYFNGNKTKTDLWFNTENPQLGNITPNQMIRIGRERKLEQFIDSALEGNRP